MPPARGVLFDLYDTLVYSDRVLYKRKIDRCAALCGVSPQKFRAAWNSLVVDSNLGRLPRTKDRAREALRILGREPDEPLVAAVAEAEHEFLRTGILLFEDSTSVLSDLREEGLRLGIVTNASRSVNVVLENTGLRERVDCVVVSSEVGIRKPDPGIYEIALRQLQARAPACAFVGDGNDAELDGAHALGMMTVMIERDISRPVTTRGSSPASIDYRVASLSELAGILLRA